MLLYFLCVPKYRNIKLGKDTDEPEFSYLQWFSMVFAAGVAVGLFFFGVAEPMWHFHGWGGARWMDADMSDTEKANHALMVTYFHWGLHGWVPYCLIGGLMSLMAYRRDLPLSMRSCLYPLWGKGIEGWKGDILCGNQFLGDDAAARRPGTWRSVPSSPTRATACAATVRYCTATS